MTPTEAFEKFKEEAELFFVKPLIYSETLKKEYENCLDILFDLTGTVDASRGLISYNSRYGQGKSFLFEVAYHRSKRKRGVHIYKMTSSRELCDIFMKTKQGEDPIKALNKFINVKNLFIDDIGDELSDGRTRKNYGNELNVVRYVILRRYELWVKNGWRLFGTTNLTREQISSNYGGRVLDRLQQMTHMRKFEFLKTGSFRQMETTRKLTQKEIQENWKKFETPEVKIKVDLEKYFNELIQEPDDYFKDRDLSFWNFTREYLERKGLLTEENYNSIDEKMIDSAELNLRKDTRESKRLQMRNALPAQRNNAIERAISSITKQNVFDSAKNAVARRVFMDLRSKKHIFV